MPDIEDLQKIKAALEEQIAQAMEEKARLKKQEEVERVKAREAEIATGLKEISILMRQYRLSKEHLFKAAKSAMPKQVAGAEGGPLAGNSTLTIFAMIPVLSLNALPCPMSRPDPCRWKK